MFQKIHSEPLHNISLFQKALAQIEIKKYDAELKERGIPKERIRHYGVAFEGKKVLIG